MEDRMIHEREVHFVSLYQAAVFWISKGYDVMPIKQYDSIPATKRGFKDAHSDLSKIEEWFPKEKIRQIPIVNIATVPMEGSSLFDMDIDRHNNDGIATWRELTKGKHVPKTLTEFTQSGGLHLSFLAESPVLSKTGILPGIDIIGQKHYAIRSPSIRKKGRYHVFDCKIANAPDWILDLLEKEPEKKKSQPSKYAFKGDSSVNSEYEINAMIEIWQSAPSGKSYRFKLAAALSGYLLRKNVAPDTIKYIISELGKRTEHADHSRVVDYAIKRLENGLEVSGGTTLNELQEEILTCLKK